MSSIEGHRTRRGGCRGLTGLRPLTRHREASPHQRPDATAPARVPEAGAVVVGVDDSPASEAAVEQALAEAELRRWDLRLLHVQPAGAARYAAGDRGARLLERMAERVHGRAPTVAVSGHLAFGAAATVLLAELSDTDLVVVGHRSDVARAASGHSIAEWVAARHRGPALVVPAPARPLVAGLPIVVGVGDPSTPTPALDFARTEAELRGCDLIVLRATGDGPAPPDPRDSPDGGRTHHRAVAGDPGRVLAIASREAAAVIVDRAGGAGVTAAFAGSVGGALVRSAACPVVLIG